MIRCASFDLAYHGSPWCPPGTLLELLASKAHPRLREPATWTHDPLLEEYEVCAAWHLTYDAFKALPRDEQARMAAARRVETLMAAITQYDAAERERLKPRP